MHAAQEPHALQIHTGPGSFLSVLFCAQLAEGPMSDRSGQHASLGRCHIQGSCILHPPVVVTGCGPIGSPVSTVGCDACGNRFDCPVSKGSGMSGTWP